MGRKDWRFLCALVIIYLGVSLIQLGNSSAPHTDWLAKDTSQSVTVELKQPSPIGRINIYGGAGMGRYTIEISTDGLTWSIFETVDHNHVFAFNWNTIEAPNATLAKYIRLNVTEPGARIIELGAFRPDRTLIPIQSVFPKTANMLVDEQSQVPWSRTAMNSTYFDEIYHARTAYEFIHHLQPYETTHPPLGKDIQAIGILLFGMTPFGWRIMGAFAGALLLAVIYFMAKFLTGQTKWAMLAAFLFSVDFMHFTQSRMGTVDTYLVLFVMLSMYFMFKYTNSARLSELAWSGLFFGLAAAVKWNGIYAGIGLAVIYTVAFIRENWISFSWKAFLQKLGYGILFFVVIPVVVYVLSYIPYVQATAIDESWKDLWTYQKDMYAYHSGLNATHPFSSTWYEWPFIHRPLWLFSGPDLPVSTVSTLVVMGNPLIWWSGTLAVCLLLFTGWTKKDTRMLLITILSLYIPWGVSPRDLTFIYHFFPILPFWILALVLALRNMQEATPRLGKMLVSLIGFASLLLFILFYPALSGFEVTRDYAEMVWKWFDSWQFF